MFPLLGHHPLSLRYFAVSDLAVLPRSADISKCPLLEAHLHQEMISMRFRKSQGSLPRLVKSFSRKAELRKRRLRLCVKKEESCEELEKALTASKRKEEDAAERLIDLEESNSELKRAVTKLKDQSANPKVDSALVEELQVKLKHSGERFEAECQKFKAHTAHELRKTQEKLKNANEQLDAARKSKASIESLLPSQVHAATHHILGAALKEYLVIIDNLLPDAIKGSITNVFSGAVSEALPDQDLEEADRSLSEDNLQAAIPNSLRTDVLEQEKLEVGESSASGTRKAKLTLIESPTASSLPMPTKLPTRPSQSSLSLQDPEAPQIPTLPATGTKVKTAVSTPQAELNPEKPNLSMVTVLKAPVKIQPNSLFMTGNPREIFASSYKKNPITPEILAARWAANPNASMEELCAEVVIDNSQTDAPPVKSEEEGTKRQGSPLQSPSKWQKWE